MKLEIKERAILFKPESSNDWFVLGRISKNVKCNIRTDNSRLKELDKEVTIPILEVLEILANGKLTTPTLK